MQKSAILTFDYELFLGNTTGTTENCVIKPTQKILDILKKNRAKAIFFVDATWLLFLKENIPGELKLVSQQLKEIISAQSSVELHLHPQWIDASQTGNKIYFESTSPYKLHLLGQERIQELFQRSIDLIENITQQKVKSFRAGGFCIDPFDQIKPAFELFDIKYDFSSAPGMYLRSGNEYDFDFSDAPKLLYYSFNNDVNIPDPQGNFVEFPLSTYNNNPFYRIINNVLLKVNKDNIFGDGTGIQQNLSFFSRLISKRLGFSTTMLTLDQIDHTLFKYVIINKFRKTPLIVIISHPKTVSNVALKNLDYISKYRITHNTNDLDKFLTNKNLIM